MVAELYLMAQIAIFMTDHPTSGSIYQDCERLGRGHVIDIFPDAHVFSATELASPLFRFESFPGVPVAQLLQFISPDLGFYDPEARKLNRVLRLRMFRLDLVALDVIKADTKAMGDIAASPVEGERYALALLKPAPVVVDPAIIGKAADLVKVIG